MIFNMGAGVPYSVPVLNGSYPADASLTVIESATGSAAFQVQIAKDGYPESYAYQWYWNGSAVSGATGSSYTRTGLTKGTYTVYCVVTNAAGSVNSRTATVSVEQYTKPTLNSSYPANVTQMEKDGSTTFKVVIATAGNPASYTYQWYWNGSAVSGATSSSYSRSAIPVGTHTVYCKVTNKAGTVTSRTATVTVNRQYFYNAGNQMSSVTGGWTANYKGDSNFLYFRDSIIEIAKNTSARTVNKINLSNYKTIYIKYYTGDSDGGSMCIMENAGADIQWDTPTAARLWLDTYTSSVTRALDVSSLTSSYYIVLATRNAEYLCVQQIWGVLK